MKLSQEHWEPIKGYEQYYQVSDLGRVKGLKRVVKSKRSKPYVVKSRLMKIDKSKKYSTVQLSRDGVSRRFYIHRLVAGAFISNPENKPEVNHIDGNKRNNRKDNLEWCTSLENVKHALDNNLNIVKGEKCGMAKLTDTQVLDINTLLNYKAETGVGMSHREIANKYGVHEDTICKISMGITWSHLTGRRYIKNK